MSAVYEFPVDYIEPFVDPWYYPELCVFCGGTDNFVWIDGKWHCGTCKEEVSDE